MSISSIVNTNRPVQGEDMQHCITPGAQGVSQANHWDSASSVEKRMKMALENDPPLSLEEQMQKAYAHAVQKPHLMGNAQLMVDAGEEMRSAFVRGVVVQLEVKTINKKIIEITKAIPSIPDDLCRLIVSYDPSILKGFFGRELEYYMQLNERVNLCARSLVSQKRVCRIYPGKTGMHKYAPSEALAMYGAPFTMEALFIDSFKFRLPKQMPLLKPPVSSRPTPEELARLPIPLLG